jgi:hypothetical protein
MDDHEHLAPASGDAVISPPGLRGFDADAVLRRSRRTNLGPWMSAGLLAVAALAALLSGHWILGLAIAAIMLPNRILSIREDQQELRALAARDDFLDALKARVEGQVLKERSRLFLGIAAAAALALLSRTRSDAAPVLVVSALILALTVMRFALVAPSLGRELKDLGGSTPAGWVVAPFFALLVIAAPFLVLYGVLRRAVRRARGSPEEPDEPEEPEEPGS